MTSCEQVSSFILQKAHQELALHNPVEIPTGSVTLTLTTTPLTHGYVRDCGSISTPISISSVVSDTGASITTLSGFGPGLLPHCQTRKDTKGVAKVTEPRLCMLWIMMGIFAFLVHFSWITESTFNLRLHAEGLLNISSTLLLFQLRSESRHFNASENAD